MNIKLPAIYSTSEYQDASVVWSEANPPTAAGLCRASLGTKEWMGSDRRARDQVFPIFWQQWDRMHLPRCAYHFLKNEAGGADQAKWFVDCVNDAGGFHPGDRIALDVEDEERETSISEIVDFLYIVMTLVPEYFKPEHVLLYSTATILNALNFKKLNAGAKAFLLQIPQWPAGYLDDPDKADFSELARWYGADLTKYGPVSLVQYAAAATVEGVSKPGSLSVEVNVADPAYLAKWQAETAAWYGGSQPPGEKPMYAYKVVAMYPAINLRADHTTSSADVGDLLQAQVAYGNDVWGDGVQEQWLHVLAVGDALQDCWVAVKHLGQPYSTLTALGTVPPPPPPVAGTVTAHIELVDKDAAGTVLATYKGDVVLTKQ